MFKQETQTFLVKTNLSAFPCGLLFFALCVNLPSATESFEDPIILVPLPNAAIEIFRWITVCTKEYIRLHTNTAL